MIGQIKIGVAGFAYADWSGVVYPAKKPRGFHQAAYLAEYFDAIEINTSFYRPLKPENCRNWLVQVAAHPHFSFTAKLWRRFTHRTDATQEDEAAVRAGLDVLRDSGKFGALLMQFPFSFHHTPENVTYLKQLLARFADYPLVVEVRHASWNDPHFYEILHHLGVGFCNIDQPVIGRSLKPSARTTASAGYVRLHGRRYDTWFTDDPGSPPFERYNYLYSLAELQPWADRIRRVSEHAQTTFVIANNHYLGKGVVNALDLLHLISGAKVKVPEPLRQHYPHLESFAEGSQREPLLFPL